MTIPDDSLHHKMYTCHFVLIGRHKILSLLGRCGEIQVGFVLGHIGAVRWGVDWHQELESAAWGSEHWHQSALKRGAGLLVALGGRADQVLGARGGRADQAVCGAGYTRLVQSDPGRHGMGDSPTECGYSYLAENPVV